LHRKEQAYQAQLREQIEEDRRRRQAEEAKFKVERFGPNEPLPTPKCNLRLNHLSSCIITASPVFQSAKKKCGEIDKEHLSGSHNLSDSISSSTVIHSSLSSFMLSIHHSCSTLISRIHLAIHNFLSRLLLMELTGRMSMTTDSFHRSKNSW
jgi:hypothetical protein